jgi:hypothetical protein
LDRLDKLQAGRDAGRELEDAQAQMRQAKMLGGKIGIKLAKRSLEDAQLQIQRLKLQGTDVRVGRTPGQGRSYQAGATTITVNIHSNQSPEQIAKQVLAQLQKRGKQGTSQHRGTAGGINRNVGIVS